MYLDITAILELILLLSSLDTLGDVLRLEYDSGSTVSCGIGPRSDFPLIKKFLLNNLINKKKRLLKCCVYLLCFFPNPILCLLNGSTSTLSDACRRRVAHRLTTLLALRTSTKAAA